jgi:phosphonopyruvate decarboxylase
MKRYDFIVGIPCSGLKYFTDKVDNYIPCTREDEAIALAAGAYMVGKRPVVFLQNSGLGNIIDAVTSLLRPYGIKIDFLISLRNRPEHHALMGRITVRTLRLLGYGRYRLIKQCEE